MNLKKTSFFVTGGTGFFGSRIVAELKKNGAKSVSTKSHSKGEIDLRDFSSTLDAIDGHDAVIHAAGVVGGIGLNKEKPYTLWRENILMGLNIMEACRLSPTVKTLVVIGTICEYPKHTPVPFQESELWKGYPEETNAPYGVAKKSLLVGGQAMRKEHGLNVIHLLPVNLFGPGDNFNPKSSHVIPAIIRKIDEAMMRGEDKVTLWGTGNATREFMYVDDAAEAVVMATENYNDEEPMNIGTGIDQSISDLAKIIAEELGFKGDIVWDTEKPDGQPKRRLDVSMIWEQLGWKSRTDLLTGIKKTVEWYRANKHLLQ